MSNRWNSDPAVSGGGVLMDNGTHSVDLLRFLLGPLSEILAVEQARPGTMKVDDCARLHVRAASGVDASVDLAWSIDKSLAYFINVYGTEGEARVGWRESSWRSYGGEWTPIGPGYGKFPAMGGALAQFCLAVRGVEPLKVTGQDAIAAAAAIDAAYTSLRDGGWARVA
jgi:predicted dehydrogenase